jgi:diadenosine tetraphosphate (Ap4A) HIT family hydrolase
MQGCLGCAIGSGATPVPGGALLERPCWVVVHAVGVVPVGTLALITRRHCLSVADLSADEAAELGPLLRLASSCVMALGESDSANVEVWSHAQFVPGHLHFVVRPASGGAAHPATREPAAQAVEAFAVRARGYFAAAS